MIAGLLVLAGTSGGIALANYTMGVDADAAPGGAIAWPAEDEASDTAPVASIAVSTASDGPLDYVCRGCGPTLAERRAQRDRDLYASDTSYVPDPPYAPDDAPVRDDPRPIPAYAAMPKPAGFIEDYSARP